MTDDELGDDSINPHYVAELLMRLLSKRVGSGDKNLQEIQFNPDFKRYKFWKQYSEIFGFDNDFIMQRIIDIVDIEGKTIGTHGNDLNSVPVSELTKLGIATANKEIEQSDKKSSLLENEITSEIQVMETSRNLKKKKQLDDFTENEKNNKLKEYEQIIEKQKQELDIERKRQKIFIGQTDKYIPILPPK